MWVFLCRHQKRVFLFTNKTERNLEVTTKSGVAPKASDFGRVTTKTELTPIIYSFPPMGGAKKQKQR
jgi:hypothetical protein